MLAALDTARADFSRAHHSCLGLESGPAYSGPGAKAGMRNDDARMEARRYSLLDYLQQHGWRMLWRGGGQEVAGLCPLHRETQPSFYVNRRKNVFYCHGCGRGGDLIRLMELLEGLTFREALTRLRQVESTLTPLEEAVRFYQRQLPRSPEALEYLRQRGIHSVETIARMRIGYAPGACLRARLENVGYARTEIEQSGLLNARGCDRLYRCLTFPLDGNANLYGHGLDRAGRRHYFLPRPKGGLYGWNQARVGCTVIVVEGLFDLASLWQAGFDNAVALLGALPNQVQLAQFCQAPPRSVYVCLDADPAGRNAARRLAAQLCQAGVYAGCVELPDGYDPNRFFVAGATASDFQHCLERARRHSAGRSVPAPPVASARRCRPVGRAPAAERSAVQRAAIDAPDRNAYRRVRRSGAGLPAAFGRGALGGSGALGKTAHRALGSGGPRGAPGAGRSGVLAHSASLRREFLVAAAQESSRAVRRFAGGAARSGRGGWNRGQDCAASVKAHLCDFNAPRRREFARAHEVARHRTANMTLRYVEITQQDLQREFLLAREKPRHLIPIPPALSGSRSAIRGCRVGCRSAERRHARAGLIPAAEPRPGQTFQSADTASAQGSIHVSQIGSERQKRKISTDWPDM